MCSDAVVRLSGLYHDQRRPGVRDRKGEWRSYVSDYFIAMATAAVPWIFITLYYMFVMLPSVYWGDAEAWKENLLRNSSRRPDLAVSSSRCWRRCTSNRVGCIADPGAGDFDDLDTILLMIPANSDDRPSMADVRRRRS